MYSDLGKPLGFLLQNECFSGCDLTNDQTGPCMPEVSEENTTPTTTDRNATSASSVYFADPRLVFYLSTVPRFCLEVFGTIGNIINLIVLSNKRMRGCFNTLLIGLTWSDFFLLTNSLLVDTWALLNTQSHQTITSWPFFIKVYYFFFVFTIGNTCLGASSIITCSIMVFRFIAVKFPLKSNIYVTYKKVKFVIVMAFILSFFTTLKTFVQFTVVEKVVNNETVKDVSQTRYVTPVFSQVTDILQISVILFIPFSVCVIFAVLTVLTIKTSDSSMLSESIADKQRRKKESIITRMLLIVVFFYLLSCFFVGLRHVVRAKLGRAQYYSYGLGMTIFDCIARNILLLNSGINLILYSGSNAAFRETFIIIFCRKFRSKETSSDYSASNSTVNIISIADLRT